MDGLVKELEGNANSLRREKVPVQLSSSPITKRPTDKLVFLWLPVIDTFRTVKWTELKQDLQSISTLQPLIV